MSRGNSRYAEMSEMYDLLCAPRHASIRSSEAEQRVLQQLVADEVGSLDAVYPHLCLDGRSSLQRTSRERSES